MRILTGIVAAGLCTMASCNLPTTPASNNNSGSGPLIKMTVDDGSGAFSVHGATSVTDVGQGQCRST